MKKLFYILLFLTTVYISGLDLNVHDIISLKIPDSIEIISVDQSLKKHSSSDQFCLRIAAAMIYANKYLPLRIDLFGYNNYNDFAAIYGQRRIEKYYPEYRTASQIDFLKENYSTDVKINKEGNKYSILVSEWASGWSTDYYGVYFKIDNSYFSEVVISLFNVWAAFGGHNLLTNDKDYTDKAPALGSAGTEFIALLQQIVDSVTLLSDGAKINRSIAFQNYKRERGLYIPTIENLRLRSSPSLDGEILGYVQKAPHIIIGVGPSLSVDGIDGKWLRITGLTDPTTGWAFSGYLRKLSDEEEMSWTEGI